MGVKTDNLLAFWRRKSRKVNEHYFRFLHRFLRPLRGIGAGVNVLSAIASVLLLGCMVMVIGFSNEISSRRLLLHGISLARIIFLINILYNLVFNRDELRRQGSSKLRWIFCAGVLITSIPLIYPRPTQPWLPWLADLLYSNKFIYPILIGYAIVELSYGVMRLIGRRTNPSLLLSASFLILIFIGTLMLMLPKSTYSGITFTDALFISTSAVCITGLTPVDIYVNFTPLGLLVLAFLIQIGGLGVMTFTSFFALFFSGRSSIYSQLMLRDMIYSKTMSALVPTLLYILGFTLVIEAIGAVMVFISCHGQLGMSLNDELVFCTFHSLSSFCNAGFSTLPGGLSNPLLLYSNGAIYWITSILIISGSIGFPILVNFKDALGIYIKRVFRRLHIIRIPDNEPRNIHPYNMNTKIVLTTFGILFAVGAGLFYLFEYTNTLAGMDWWWQLTQSVFNSAVPRSAGFASVNPAAFRPVTLVMIMFLMWVGGASQSTGGGVKVNTFAAICLNLRSIVTGRDKVIAFRRTVAVWSIRRANAVVALSILSYVVYSMIILWLEPGLPVRGVLFEVLSALFTVGSSLGVTSDLSPASSLVLCSAMFLGRVGIISLISGVVGRRSDLPLSMPTDNLIIN